MSLIKKSFHWYILCCFYIALCVCLMFFAIPTRFALMMSYSCNIFFVIFLMIENVNVMRSFSIVPDFESKEFWDNIKWSCCVCSKMRPDNKIDTVRHDLSLLNDMPPDSFVRNVRFCADDFECIKKAFDIANWRR